MKSSYCAWSGSSTQSDDPTERPVDVTDTCYQHTCSQQVYCEHQSTDAPRVPTRRAAVPLVTNSDAVLVETTKWLAENVRARRRAAGISQERLAEMARVSAIYVGQVEREKATNPSLSVIASLAAALSCSVAELLVDVGRSADTLNSLEEMTKGPMPPAAKRTKK